MWSLNATSESESPAGALNRPAEPLIVEQLQLKGRLVQGCPQSREKGAREEGDTDSFGKCVSWHTNLRGAGQNWTIPRGASWSVSVTF